MVITQTNRGQAAILALSGRLDFNGRNSFQTAIQKAKESGAHSVVLDMKDVSFIDSAALGLVTVAFKNLEAEKLSLTIANCQDYVNKVFNLANIGNIIKIYSSVDEALAGQPRVGAGSR